jgi:hypothetical protein
MLIVGDRFFAVVSILNPEHSVGMTVTITQCIETVSNPDVICYGQ